jgi:hypothetical protein
MTIDERNRLRSDAGLPLLDVEAEGARLAAVQRDTDFEQYYDQNRHRVAWQWTDRGRGWLTNAGIWAAARRQLRREFETLNPN